MPTTWEELAALGEKVAAEHPGYLIGAFGDALSLDMYFWTARCATGQLKDEDTVYINVLAPECVRAAQWVDKMQALGVVAKVGTFDPTFIDAANKDMLLLLTAPSWFGEFVFGGTPDSVYYTEANGQLGVALPPKWEADDQPYFGGQGGAAWAVSRHTQNPKLAVDLVTWLSTANEYQVDLAPTYPAFKPPAKEWVTTHHVEPALRQRPGTGLHRVGGVRGSALRDRDVRHGEHLHDGRDRRAQRGQVHRVVAACLPGGPRPGCGDRWLRGRDDSLTPEVARSDGTLTRLPSDDPR